MKSSTPWSVKGVDDEARELAREAAQSAGLTLGAWIDRAIRKSTGLPMEPTKSPLGTTASTTRSIAALETPPDEAGVDRPDTPVDGDRPSETGATTGPVDVEEAGSSNPQEATTHAELQVDPEERYSATVEAPDTPARRRWFAGPGPGRFGVRPVHVMAATSVLVAGLVIYWLAFTGPDDRDTASSTTRADATGTTAPAPAATPGAGERDDTPATAEPGVTEMLTAAAEQGDAVAQHDLAVRYLDGRTVDTDLSQAAKWMERAASQGMAQAQYRLAAMFADGTGVATDANRAAMWHTRAAQQGHPGAQHALALAYAAGRGVKPSQASAVEWLGRAARAGNIPSQLLLAEWYESGRGVPRDRAKAIEWYRRASAKGDAGAAARIAQIEAETESAAKTKAGAASGARPTPTESATASVAASPRPEARLDPAAPLDKAGVAEVQRLLARLAFKPGPPDGVLGRRTVREIKLYQRFAGLPDDGEATRGLLLELREMVRGMSDAKTPDAR